MHNGSNECTRSLTFSFPAVARAALCAHVCKVYRFQTEDQRWLLVREQLSETPLSFSLPKQLLGALIREHGGRSVSERLL